MCAPNVRLELDVLDSALRRVERCVAPEYDYSDDTRFYGWEPLDARQFLDGLAALGPPKGRSFVDVGCGIGTKLALAHECGWTNLSGVDRSSAYIGWATKICPQATFVCADAADFDYRSFDVVYMFWPLRDHDEQAQLERLIYKRMKPGAIAWFAHSAAGGFGEPIATGMWRTI